MSKEGSKFRVGLGVCGGIAAYKAVEVLRGLQKAGCDVAVCMTRHATEFVQPLTFRALTGEYVLVDDYASDNPDPIAHINFSQNLDAFLIVPATANVLAKFANGIADDFLTSAYLAANAPVIVAPAMNTEMWNKPATQRNIAALKADGVRFIEPVSGELACKTIGTGKLEDVDLIVRQTLAVLGGATNETRNMIDPFSQSAPVANRDLEGERILITTGGTREAIDPVRYISNHSSGKMGFAIAQEAADRGAEVMVVMGSVSIAPPDNVKVIKAVSAAEMHLAVTQHIDEATVFIGAAAVADYRPKFAAESKIKKTEQNTLTIELEPTVDILSEVAHNRAPGLLVVGFAAETNDVISYARGKLERKNLDMIVANDVTEVGAGFGSDDNKAAILTRSETIALPLMPKIELATHILNAVLKLRNA